MTSSPDGPGADVPLLALLGTPLERDQEALAAALEAAGCEVTDLDGLGLAERGAGDLSEVGLFLLTEEAATDAIAETLLTALDAQPDWSSVPIMFVVRSADRLPPACRALLKSRHASAVTALARPVKPSILRLSINARLAARRRQLETGRLFAELEASEGRQRFLLDELKHRTRNALTVINALFALSAEEAESAEELRAAFGGRLKALTTAHIALDDRDERDLREVVRQHTAPFVRHDRQIELSGEPVLLAERKAFDLALVLNELATNAAKYGALSTEAGRVEVRWNVTPDTGKLSLTWEERGGPPVTPPTREGLGSRLISGLTLGSSASCEVAYPPSGLVWRVEMPVA